MAIVRELYVYPLKSGHRLARSSVLLTASGFECDRHWMLVDARGRFLSQRTHPRLALIRPELAADTLTLRAPGLEPLLLPLAPQGEPVRVTVWDDTCEGLDQGTAAADWASHAAGEPARCVRVAARLARRANPRFAGPDPVPLAYVDGYPVLVCNRASLEELNARMPAAVPMERFRPNLVLDGLPPFAEDRIRALKVGAAVLKLVKPCTRCVITATDQERGERSDLDPLPVLKQFRFDRTLRGVSFGENAVPLAGIGTHIICGSECEVQYEP